MAPLLYDYTVDALYASVLARSFENTSATDLTAFTRICNEELVAYLLPWILSARNDYYTTNQDITMVSGQELYDLPQTSLAAELRAIALIDGNGNLIAPLEEISIEDVTRAGAVGVFANGQPANYYFQGTQIGLFPKPSGTSTNKVRMYYYQRPNVLTPIANCLVISGFPGGAAGGSFRISYSNASAPAYFTNGATVDLVQASPPFNVQLPNAAITNTGAGFVDVAGVQPAALAIGSYICPSGQAPVITGTPAEIVLGPYLQHLKLQLMDARADDGAVKRAFALKSAAEKQSVQYLRRRNTGNNYRLTASIFKFKGSFGGSRRFG